MSEIGPIINAGLRKTGNGDRQVNQLEEELQITAPPQPGQRRTRPLSLVFLADLSSFKRHPCSRASGSDSSKKCKVS